MNKIKKKIDGICWPQWGEDKVIINLFDPTRDGGGGGDGRENPVSALQNSHV